MTPFCQDIKASEYIVHARLIYSQAVHCIENLGMYYSTIEPHIYYKVEEATEAVKSQIEAIYDFDSTQGIELDIAKEDALQYILDGPLVVRD